MSAEDLQGEAASTQPTHDPSQLIFSWRNIKGEIEKGPLHLLWQLIDSYKVNIFHVSLQQITGDFLKFLQRVQELSLEPASAFIVMAAKMLFYKSQAILPNPNQEPGGEEDRLPAELVQQLLEYRRFQAAAEKLRDVEEIAAGLYPHAKGAVNEEEEWLDCTVADLTAAYLSIADWSELEEEESLLAFPLEQHSVEEKIAWLEELFNRGNAFYFTELLQEQVNRGRGAVIALFLALLELANQKIIVLRQKASFSEIHLLKRTTLLK